MQEQRTQAPLVPADPGSDGVLHLQCKVLNPISVYFISFLLFLVIILQFRTFVEQDIADAVDEAAQIYEEEMPLDEQSGKWLSDVLDTVIKKTTEELGHKFNKQQSIANPALGKQFLEEVVSLPSHFVLLAYSATFFQ